MAKYLQQVGAVVSLDKGEAGKQGRDAIAKVPFLSFYRPSIQQTFKKMSFLGRIIGTDESPLHRNSFS